MVSLLLMAGSTPRLSHWMELRMNMHNMHIRVDSCTLCKYMYFTSTYLTSSHCFLQFQPKISGFIPVSLFSYYNPFLSQLRRLTPTNYSAFTYWPSSPGHGRCLDPHRAAGLLRCLLTRALTPARPLLCTAMPDGCD